MTTRGLVIGKFYPPHRGHKLLIDTALAGCGELTVVVCDRADQLPRGDVRAAWLREIHPQARVIVVDDCVDAEDSRGWADYTRQFLGYAPEIVFSSEDYGVRYAGFLSARHVLVDRERQTVPISGTQVRTDPLGAWDFLEPPVRAHYAIRVCLVGAESTGKTTLARALAEHFHTEWVPEFGRVYAEDMLAKHGQPTAKTARGTLPEYRWTTEDFITIARTQCEHEEAAARRCNKVLVCDTDAFATGIWHRRYMGVRCAEVERLAAAWKRPELYLVTDVDMPFVQDGTRDGEHLRAWMHGVFLEELAAQGRSFQVISGTHAERLRAAVAFIEALSKKVRSQK